VPPPQQPAAAQNPSANAETKPAVMNRPPASPVAPSPALQPPAMVPLVMNTSASADIKPETELTKPPATFRNSGERADLSSETIKKKVSTVPVFPPATPQHLSAAKPRQRVMMTSATENIAPILAPASRQGPSLITRQRSSVGTTGIAGKNSSMDEIYKSIGQNLQTPDGEKYIRAFSWEFSLKNSHDVRDCLEAGKKDPGPFDVVVQVGSDGTAQQAMIFPDTGVSGCVARRMATASFSAPPGPGYWVKVTLANR
jgi:hypothetical protein